jgi:hypothetical protein
MSHIRTVLAGAGILIAAAPIAAQDPAPAVAIDTALARRYFQEAEALTARDAGRLWARSLAGPLLLVDRASRTAIADRPDAEGRLRPVGSLFVGTLPASENVANTAFRWSGVLWAMVALPVPSDSLQRSVLLAHELWHRVQDSLGFSMANPTNAHLGQREGRLWLRLEGRALQRALTQEGATRARTLRDAIAFRRARRARFPGADSTERALELNEGLAEYSGIVLATESPALRRELVARRLAGLDTMANFERSFAYRTGPAYGLFLDEVAPAWRISLSRHDDLSYRLGAALGADGARRPAATRAAPYGYERVQREERTRAARQAARLAELKRRFVAGLVLELPLAEMKMGFDPGRVESLDGVGSVYGSLRLTDRWGVLQCDGSGGLIAADYSSVVVPAPADIAGRRLTGPGWVLELSAEWRIVPGKRSGDYTVTASPAAPAPPPAP